MLYEWACRANNCRLPSHHQVVHRSVGGTTFRAIAILKYAGIGYPQNGTETVFVVFGSFVFQIDARQE